VIGKGRGRIVTTNFDTLFERSWLQKHGKVITSHANSAMPQPKASGFRGVLHLHGRLADNRQALNLAETDLVLTSAEFGEAYLRSGWASRYVYDLVRAHTVVLVGYEADDPPMRYLLEVLESDRERFSDLHKVFAFAPSEPREETLTAELWRAKGVEPILYHPNENDHSPLYDSLREWKRYDADPTVRRREQLRPILAAAPESRAKEDLQRCASLLGHSDASPLLRELSPSPDWLMPLSERAVFGPDKARPGEWIAGRLNDAEMIRACVELRVLDDESIWHVERAIEQNQGNLSPVRLRAWRLILRGKPPSRSQDLRHEWYRISRHVRQGEAGHNIRQLVRRMLQPRLKIAKPFHLYQSEGSRADESLSDLLRVDFESDGHPTSREILQEWPETLNQEVALFRVLERGLLEALEEAADVGHLDNRDRASWDVPSMADHPQNAHHTGFFPIVRTMADLWSRIALKDSNKARAIVADGITRLTFSSDACISSPPPRKQSSV
jgi:SIR2-like domain